MSIIIMLRGHSYAIAHKLSYIVTAVIITIAYRSVCIIIEQEYEFSGVHKSLLGGNHLYTSTGR